MEPWQSFAIWGVINLKAIVLQEHEPQQGLSYSFRSLFFPVITHISSFSETRPLGLGEEGSVAQELTMLYLGLMPVQNSEPQPSGQRKRKFSGTKDISNRMGHGLAFGS